MNPISDMYLDARNCKKWGQHFLNDVQTAKEIVHLLGNVEAYQAVVEVGPGKGALTEWLIPKVPRPLYLVEIDRVLVAVLRREYVRQHHIKIVEADFLQWAFPGEIDGDVAVIGNFPYNISSQIFFTILKNKQQVREVVCMLQDEVAKRITAKPGNKTYGLLSVLLQAFYDISYVFSVPPEFFNPPPKVISGVLHLMRNATKKLACDEAFFVQVVKTAFQQRRKMLKNALASLGKSLIDIPERYLTKRAEELSVSDFVFLTQRLR